MQIARLASGISSIDLLTDGGFPLGSVILYYGDTGSGKTFASLKFLQEGLKTSDSNLLITSHLNLSTLEQIGKLMDLNISEITCIDAANWRTKRIDRNSQTFSKYEVSDLTDLNALLAMIIQVYKENPKICRITFDSLSNLLLYSTPSVEQVMRFFELLTAFVRKNKITFVFTMEKNLHPEYTVSSFYFLSDGVLEFHVENGKRYVKSLFLQYTDNHNPMQEWK
ncbi:MAG: RAD55 family ATPase [Candidatus Kariarchaeaceae archaeon]|jgi:KaiC/GvpD/RAD55 family RecA-like ATPase